MNSDPNIINSIDMLKKEFIRRGYSYEHIALSDKNFSLFIGPNNWSWLTPIKNVSYPFVSFAASRISALKHVTYEAAKFAGLSIPATLDATNATQAEKAAFLDANTPIVVKPIHSHGSQGVSLNITKIETLHEALRKAKNEEGVLLQQQFSGQEIRVTVFKNQVVSAILRQTPQVVGDGKNTIAQLITNENLERESLVFDCLVYPQLTNQQVKEPLLYSQIVPAKGEVVELNKSTLVSGGASLYNITEELHESYKHAVLRLAKIINPDFLVVDIMVQNYRQPLTNKNYVFIETNTSPSLKLYYAVRDGKRYDIITQLVDAIIKYRSGLTS